MTTMGTDAADVNTPRVNTRRRRYRPPGAEAVQQVRAVRALELRMAGAAYRTIATTLGVSVRTAFTDVQAELGRLDGAARQRVERFRDLESCRLDMYLRSLTAQIDQGDVPAVLAAVRISERRSTLFGLDAPTKPADSDGGSLPPTRVVIELVAEKTRESVNGLADPRGGALGRAGLHEVT